MDQEKPTGQFKNSLPEQRNSALQEIFRKLRSDMGRSKQGQEQIDAAFEAAQRMALQMDTSAAAGPVAEAQERPACHSCGNHNARENRFCARCGVPLEGLPDGEAPTPDVKLINPLSSAGQHHYHHHYHHHYFSASNEVTPASSEPRFAASVPVANTAKPRTASGAGPSRAEAALRKLAQDWALACNTKHLDDLLELYTSDAMILRPNVAPVRTASAIRELFFTALEAGLGEVQMDPLRVEIFGDIAYEVGRCTMLAPSATGSRREERGKYVLLAARQAGEWKILVDCWSTDLSLGAGIEAPAKPHSAAGSPRSLSKGT